MSLRLKVIDGTPIHSGKGLCNSCAYSHIFRGIAESDVHVQCAAGTGLSPTIIRKPVIECNSYQKVTDKSLKQMQEIGWVLASKNGRSIGFLSPREAKTKADSKQIDELKDIDD